MIIYPAMDLMAGKVVRLRQGRFDDATTYPADPARALRQFESSGAQWVHIVDLDGARAGEPRQHDLLAGLAKASDLQLQVAGGIRTAGHIARLLEGGVARVVVGSLAVTRPELVRSFIDSFGPERITLSLDVRMADGEPIVATHGWTQDSGLTLWDVAARFPGARHLLLTDIGHDGMLAGPNFDLLEEAGSRLPHLAIQASGGVTSLDDVARLTTAGAILGRAMWEGRIDLAEAVRHARA
jgi:phosphoribosylformimino-5-aminoimidazole carboxamide ribotide isomerase